MITFGAYHAKLGEARLILFAIKKLVQKNTVLGCMIMIIGGIRWNISVYGLQNWYYKHIKWMFQQLLNFLFIWLSGIHHEYMYSTITATMAVKYLFLQDADGTMVWNELRFFVVHIMLSIAYHTASFTCGFCGVRMLWAFLDEESCLLALNHGGACLVPAYPD